MAKTPKFPNPSFYKYKDHIDWAAQAKNLKDIGAICVDMAKENDWNATGKSFVKGWKDFRCPHQADEFNEVMAMSLRREA
jgi:hypothetical protein